MSSFYSYSFSYRIFNLKSLSVETVIPHMVTYEVPLLPYPIWEGEDPVQTRTIIPNIRNARVSQK